LQICALELRSSGVVAKQQTIRQPAQAALGLAAVKTPLTMRHLWRMTLWAATAASALLLAVLSSRSEIGTQRVASIFSLHGKASAQPAKPAFDAQAETSRLAEAVRGLRTENGQLQSRLTAVEQNVDGITGSVTKQIEEVKAEAAKPDAGVTWPADAADAPITPAIIASIVSPFETADGVGPPIASPPLTMPAQSADDDAHSAEAPRTYGVDVGGAYSTEILRARWLGIRSAHMQLFAGLTPTAVLRSIPKSNRIELRLVVGPLDSSEAAARLCAALAAYRLYCQLTSFDHQSVALR
jgi:hypothetical protein